MATLGLFLLGVGEIKKLGGVRTHGSHVFKNSLAGSRLGPEHRCSGPVMLTQHAGTRRLPLPILVTRSTAQQPLAPTGAQLGNHPGEEAQQSPGGPRSRPAAGHSRPRGGSAGRPLLRPSPREPRLRPSRAGTYRFEWKSCTQPEERKDNLALCWPVPSPPPAQS